MRFNTRVEEAVRLGEETLEGVDHFIYLGGIVNKTGGCDKDIKSRLGAVK